MFKFLTMLSNAIKSLFSPKKKAVVIPFEFCYSHKVLIIDSDGNEQVVICEAKNELDALVTAREETECNIAFSAKNKLNGLPETYLYRNSDFTETREDVNRLLHSLINSNVENEHANYVENGSKKGHTYEQLIAIEDYIVSDHSEEGTIFEPIREYIRNFIEVKIQSAYFDYINSGYPNSHLYAELVAVESYLNKN